ncbi:hypothetical protein BDK51DRAFT_47597 [Blyttiomyces helicus]|uniref:Uncharacterized protein n=1 Tax=Blyttiomyces helicus TaxID=388810 RepID=A0A4P9W388_9FUNG|nr:hypothetical protein BDK51DRAFT_47597 [Blyttiomyces helicus]|eukprot:RKO86761.1 hypothetical protein BDK51DRAFT_47597 [Blyttiomyces helicus]
MRVHVHIVLALLAVLLPFTASLPAHPNTTEVANTTTAVNTTTPTPTPTLTNSTTATAIITATATNATSTTAGNATTTAPPTTTVICHATGCDRTFCSRYRPEGPGIFCLPYMIHTPLAPCFADALCAPDGQGGCAWELTPAEAQCVAEGGVTPGRPAVPTGGV